MSNEPGAPSTGKLLLDEQPLIILPSLATIVGLNEAIFLQQLHYWLRIAKAGNGSAGGKFHEDRWWIYNSYKDWQEKNFPFWSEGTIKRVIQVLVKLDIVLTHETVAPAQDGGSQKWYTIDYERLEFLTGYDQFDHTPIYIESETTSESNESLEQRDSVPPQKLANAPDGDLPDVIASNEQSPDPDPLTPPEQPRPKPRDVLFELVVTRGFGVDLGDPAAVAAICDKANWITSWCKGNEVSMGGRSKKKLPGCTPPLTVEGLERFYSWFEKNQRIGKPETAPGMAKWVSRARQALGRRSTSVATPTPPANPERADRLRAKTRALLDQMGGQS